jgi:predicted Rossmann-fold nucleotide-binding protein
MEASARGAKAAGGQTIGVTISLYQTERPNVWLDQEIVAESLFARLEQLVTLGDAFLALRGGIGTLLELALVWNLVQSPEFAHKPIVVVGASWERVVATLRDALPMHRWEEHSLTLVPTVEDAIRHLDGFFGAGGAQSARSRAEDPGL